MPGVESPFTGIPFEKQIRVELPHHPASFVEIYLCTSILPAEEQKELEYNTLYKRLHPVNKLQVNLFWFPAWLKAGEVWTLGK
jgi:hypothetical protein